MGSGWKEGSRGVGECGGGVGSGEGERGGGVGSGWKEGSRGVGSGEGERGGGVGSGGGERGGGVAARGWVGGGGDVDATGEKPVPNVRFRLTWISTCIGRGTREVLHSLRGCYMIYICM